MSQPTSLRGIVHQRNSARRWKHYAFIGRLISAYNGLIAPDTCSEEAIQLAESIRNDLWTLRRLCATPINLEELPPK